MAVLHRIPRIAVRICVPALSSLLLFALASPAGAVRPFVTDDARIIDRGQVEIENWLESTRGDGQWDPAPGFNAIVGSSVTDWFEILAGGGVGADRVGGSTLGNPMVMGKILLRPSQVNGRPGVAFSASTVLDHGHGSMYLPGRVSVLLGMSTWRLLDDHLHVHVNLGMRNDRGLGFDPRRRAQWGVGIEAHTPFEKTRFVGEVFSGDPLVLHAPSYAMQTGVRRVQSDYLQFDLVLGLEPALDDQLRRRSSLELSVQLGVRVLFDVFTRGGRPGDPDGARGFFGNR